MCCGRGALGLERGGGLTVPSKPSQQLTAANLARWHLPLHEITKHSQLTPAEVKKILRDLPPAKPRRKSP